MKQVQFLYDTDSGQHAPTNHPDSAWRHDAVARAAARLSRHATVRNAWEAATVTELLSVHEPCYVQRVLTEKGQPSSDPENPRTPGSIDAALRAVTVALASAKHVVLGNGARAVAAVRPAGHHASKSSAWGYCVFNNAALAAQYALDQGVARVLIVDIDVHHCDGTVDIFAKDPRVAIISLHQAGLFPVASGTVDENTSISSRAMILNVPLPIGAGDSDYVFALNAATNTMIERFVPALLIVSCGFDAHVDDPTSEMNVSTACFTSMTLDLSAVASATTGGKILLVLEGGYDTASLEDCLVHCTLALTGIGQRVEPGQPTNHVKECVAQALAAFHNAR